MGQRANPLNIRLGYSTFWDSIWYSEKNFPHILHEDFEIKRFMSSIFKPLSILINRIMIKRIGNSVYLNTYVYYNTLNNNNKRRLPTDFKQALRIYRIRKRRYRVFKRMRLYGLIHGSKVLSKSFPNFRYTISKFLKKRQENRIVPGSMMERTIALMRQEARLAKEESYSDEEDASEDGKKSNKKIIRGTLKGIRTFLSLFTGTSKLYLSVINLFFFNLKNLRFVKQRMRVLSRFRRFRFQRHLVFFYNILLHTKSANLMTQAIKNELWHLERVKKNRDTWKLISFLFRLVDLYSESLVGVRLHLKGRFNGIRRTRTYKMSSGSVSLNTFKQNIDYSYSTALTKSGSYGIKLWVRHHKK